MPSTYSTNLALELIANGDQAGTWGATTNTNLGTLLEQAIAGYATYALTGGTDAITIPNGASGTARNMFLKLTGTGGGTLTVPDSKSKIYFIWNATGGGSAVTVKTVSGTGISVPDGAKIILFSDGTNIIAAQSYLTALTLGTALPVASGGTGAVSLTSGYALIGNGTGTIAGLAPGTSGNIMTSNGSTWTSAAPAATVTSLTGTADQITVSASTGAVTVSVPSTSNGYGVRNVSASAPSGGNDGDIWIQY